MLFREKEEDMGIREALRDRATRGMRFKETDEYLREHPDKADHLAAADRALYEHYEDDLVCAVVDWDGNGVAAMGVLGSNLSHFTPEGSSVDVAAPFGETPQDTAKALTSILREN